MSEGAEEMSRRGGVKRRRRVTSGKLGPWPSPLVHDASQSTRVHAIADTDSVLRADAPIALPEVATFGDFET
jgi:hypothetical protein